MFAVSVASNDFSSLSFGWLSGNFMYLHRFQFLEHVRALSPSVLAVSTIGCDSIQTIFLISRAAPNLRGAVTCKSQLPIIWFPDIPSLGSCLPITRRRRILNSLVKVIITGGDAA
jgi:hypothetical protein